MEGLFFSDACACSNTLLRVQFAKYMSLFLIPSSCKWKKQVISHHFAPCYSCYFSLLTCLCAVVLKHLSNYVVGPSSCLQLLRMRFLVFIFRGKIAFPSVCRLTSQPDSPLGGKGVSIFFKHIMSRWILVIYCLFEGVLILVKHFKLFIDIFCAKVLLISVLLCRGVLFVVLLYWSIKAGLNITLSHLRVLFTLKLQPLRSH